VIWRVYNSLSACCFYFENNSSEVLTAEFDLTLVNLQIIAEPPGASSFNVLLPPGQKSYKILRRISDREGSQLQMKLAYSLKKAPK
jgi:hypothetical protein